MRAKKRNAISVHGFSSSVYIVSVWYTTYWEYVYLYFFPERISIARCVPNTHVQLVSQRYKACTSVVCDCELLLVDFFFCASSTHSRLLRFQFYLFRSCSNTRWLCECARVRCFIIVEHWVLLLPTIVNGVGRPHPHHTCWHVSTFETKRIRMEEDEKVEATSNMRRMRL